MADGNRAWSRADGRAGTARREIDVLWSNSATVFSMTFTRDSSSGAAAGGSHKATRKNPHNSALFHALWPSRRMLEQNAGTPPGTVADQALPIGNADHR
jgi:hypothetical protein